MIASFYYVPPHRLPVPAYPFVPEDVVLGKLPHAPIVFVAGENLVPFAEYVRIIAVARRVAVATRAVIDEMKMFASFADLVVSFPPTRQEIARAVGWLKAGGEPLRDLVTYGWGEDLIYSVCAVPPELVRSMRSRK